MSKKIYTLITLISLILVTLAFGQWQPDYRLTIDPGLSTGTYNNATKVAVSGNVVHVVWHDERSGNEIWYTRSIDDGATWPASPANDVRLTNCSGTSNYAAVAVNGDTVHVVWNDSRDGNSEIYYTRSVDGGVTWPVSPAGDVRLTNATLTSEYPAIAVSGDTVHVVWVDYRDDTSGEIYYTRSIDGGTTWPVSPGGDIRLTTSVGFASWWPSIAVNGNNVHVVWRDTRDGNIEIYYKRSIDGGTTWGSDFRLTINTAESWNPSVAVAGDTVHVVWSDSRISGSNFEIYYNRSTDNGTTWFGTDTRLTNATGNSHFPSVAAEGSDVHVVWQDARGGSNNDVFYIHSADNGTTWPSDTNLTNVSATNKYLPGVAAKGGNVHVVWRDLRDGNSEMYYKRYVGTVYYTITATAHEGGTIIPSGAVLVPAGIDTSFTITPNPGYSIDSVVVDGVSQGPITYHSFHGVDDNHAIDAYFSISTFTILATATSGGIITPSDSVIVNYGEDTTFTIAPNTDYQLDSVLVDEVSVGAVTSYPFTDVIDNHTIHAIFSMTALPGWTQKESLPPLVKDGGALVGVTGSKDGDLLFAFRGAKSKEFYMYNGTWTAKETIPFGYKYPLTEPPAINKKVPGKGAAFCYDGVNTIYATKGNGTYEFWAYDLTSDAGWTAKAFVPSTQKLKGGTSMAYYEGKVYLLAGAQKKDNLNNFFVYNPAADSDLGIPWTALSGAPVTPPLTLKAKPFKDGSAIAVIGNTIYAIKGGDKYNFFYAYDIATDIWTELETIPLVHSALGKKNKVGDGGAMTTDGSILYVIKGKGKQDFWSYNPISEGVWTSLDTIPRVGVAFKKSVPKTGAGLAYANSRVWLLKGNKTYEFWSFVLSKENSKVNFVGQGFSLATQSKPKGLPYMQTATIDVTPNPFTKLTTIRYTVPISGKVSLKLYNATGRLIEILQDGYLSSGIYSMNLSDIVKGIYFLKYESNTNKSEVKLIVQ